MDELLEVRSSGGGEMEVKFTHKILDKEHQTQALKSSGEDHLAESIKASPC